MGERSNWIAIASAGHVRIGRAQGFMQVNHGKAAPLKRITPGDCVAYYSPTITYGGNDRLQAFTALGIVKAGEPFQFDMGGGFHPFRREVRWLQTHDAPIQPLLERMEFSTGIRNWGQKFRYDLFRGERSRHARGSSAVELAGIETLTLTAARFDGHLALARTIRRQASDDRISDRQAHAQGRRRDRGKVS